MKTRLSQSAVALTIALFIFIGNVQATEKVTKASSHENLNETALTLENWMVDESVWNTVDFSDYQAETEANLVLEGWMTDAKVWNTTFTVESEAAMELERWMTDDLAWDVQLNFQVDTESALTLEEWMINENTWKR